jgi:hypothetical protein
LLQPAASTKIQNSIAASTMNLLDATIEVSSAPDYPTLEFAASGGVLNPDAGLKKSLQ